MTGSFSPSLPARRSIGGGAVLAASLLIAGVVAPDAAADGSPAATGLASTVPSLPPPCGEPLQAIVDAAPPSSDLRLPACTSTETLIIREPLLVDARGTVIDGRNTLEHAVIVEASDVRITGLRVIGAANPPQDGAVRAWDVDRFVFRDGIISDSDGACISVARGSDAVIEGSTLARCGQEGIHATRADRLVVRGNRIEDNNPRHAYDPEWEAGGAKVTQSTGVQFEGNEVSGNDGPGIWCDIDCRDLVVRDNRVWANERAGIQVEISDGAKVTDNAVWENGWAKPAWGWGAGILVSSSREVEVGDNTLAWNADGVVVVSQDREDAPSLISGNRTSGNLVAAESGREVFAVAWLQDWAGGLFDAANGNGGTADVAWFDRPEDHDVRFAWDGPLTSLRAFSATPGGAGVSYATDEILAARLAAAGIPPGPAGGHPLGAVGLRDLLPLVPLLTGAALLVLSVAVLLAFGARRRRARSGESSGIDRVP